MHWAIIELTIPISIFLHKSWWWPNSYSCTVTCPLTGPSLSCSPWSWQVSSSSSCSVLRHSSQQGKIEQAKFVDIIYLKRYCHYEYLPISTTSRYNWLWYSFFTFIIILLMTLNSAINRQSFYLLLTICFIYSNLKSNNQFLYPSINWLLNVLAMTTTSVGNMKGN